MNGPSPENHDSELASLLQSADAEYAVACQMHDAGALVEAARQRQSRSRRAHVVSTAVGVAMLLIAVSLPGSRTAEPMANAKASDDAAVNLHRTLAALDQEAEQRRRIVLALRQVDRLEACQAELQSLASAAGSSSAADESSRSGAISLQYAKLTERETGDVEQARIEYQRVRERFAGTQWAAAADSSLVRLKAAERPSL